MRVLYLFNRVRKGLVERIERGESHDNHFYGMLRLRRLGVDAQYIEIEDYFPKSVCMFVRKHFLNIYFVHLPLFWKFLSYDIVFTSTAFGTQLFHFLYPFKKPLWVMHDFSIMGFLGKEKTFKQKVFRFLIRRVAGIVTISQNETDRLVARFPEIKDRVRFIRLGTDLSFFAPKDIPEADQILTVGFDPGRDYATFFKACATLPVSVLIATRPAKLEGQALSQNIRAQEFKPLEMADAYAASKVIVLPLDIRGGVNDAMGCSTLVEAMAMGKVVVATRTPTMESYITDGENGFLVEPGDAEGLRKAIATLLNDDELRKRVGKKACAFAVEKCDADQCAREMYDFFESIRRRR